MTARCGSGSRRCGAGSVHDTAASRNPKIELIKAVRERIGVADPGSLRATAPGGSVAKIVKYPKEPQVTRNTRRRSPNQTRPASLKDNSIDMDVFKIAPSIQGPLQEARRSVAPWRTPASSSAWQIPIPAQERSSTEWSTNQRALASAPRPRADDDHVE